MSYQPILNPELFKGEAIILSADVHDPNTIEVRWAKGYRLKWLDVIEMLKLGITDIPVVS